jgi:hypothetical protein
MATSNRTRAPRAEVFILLCHEGIASREGAPEFTRIYEHRLCQSALEHAKSFIRLHETNNGYSEVWLGRNQLLWTSRELDRTAWSGPAAVGRYAVTFDDAWTPTYTLAPL